MNIFFISKNAVSAIICSMKLCLHSMCGEKSAWPLPCAEQSLHCSYPCVEQICSLSPHMEGSNVDFAPHMEGSHAYFALQMERRHSFMDQKID